MATSASWSIAVAAAATIVTGYAALSGQTPTEKSWTAYGGHADSSRYLDSKQITKANVSQLQVAWTYPLGETVFHPLMVHGSFENRSDRPRRRQRGALRDDSRSRLGTGRADGA